MKKAFSIIITLIAGIGFANATERSTQTITRSATKQNTIIRTDTNTQRNISGRATTGVKARNTATKSRVAARSVTPTPTNRLDIQNTRSATNTPVRSAIKSRSGTNRLRTNTTTKTIRPARAATTISTTPSETFGTDYTECRDAYFTCMDQFCATADDTYRRCICSSRLTEMQSKQSALSQTTEQIADFKNLNLAVIDKSAAEVTAMITETAGEYAQSIAKDTSDSALQLANINNVLSKSKQKSLSTQGTLDIAGDINQIWATTDLTGGANIANLTGEALYNAVHAQCSELVSDKCQSNATKTMVVSAYGMYIENDCSLMANSLSKEKNSTNSEIRKTEREMNLARLENYNAHNSTSINDCIAQVRIDITAETACGKDYVHCLDTTGRYLNSQTGEPIYSPEFYQLESQTSLSGDILTNQYNRLLVSHLNRFRKFAERGLDTCRDISDTVWDEFMRQAIAEIYQGQQERVRKVKNECLTVVMNCYDEQSQSLKDFSNIKEQLMLGARLELSEQMCREKLDACSNLYGGGTQGMQSLITTMHDITDQEIGKQCYATLQDFARELCAVPGNDTLHSYPYGCRMYNPGYQRLAEKCANVTTSGNQNQNQTGGSSPVLPGTGNSTGQIVHYCPAAKMYKSCKKGFYMTYNGIYNGTPRAGNKCTPCEAGFECNGETANRVKKPSGNETQSEDNCTNYAGSLYQQIQRYAKQACVRPSTSDTLPATVLQDINSLMDSIRSDMAKELAKECERMDGKWIDVEAQDDDKAKELPLFYTETSASDKWGYCAKKEESTPSDTTSSTPSTETGNQSGNETGGT